VIVFRQSAGGRLSSYDSYFVLSFMQAGFIVTAGALLPPLFALYGLSEGAVLRVASGITAIPIAWFVATVPRRRRAATGAATPGCMRYSCCCSCAPPSPWRSEPWDDRSGRVWPRTRQRSR
jgi:hypothetical protein